MLIAIIGTCLSLAITYHPTNDPLRVLHTAYPGAFLLQRWRTWCPAHAPSPQADGETNLATGTCHL